MSISLSPIFNGYQSFLSTGLPNNGGFIYTYLAGTTTLTTTYTTSAGTIPNSNPIALTSDGRPPQQIWLTNSIAYKFVITDANLNIVSGATFDNIFSVASSLAASTGAGLIGYQGFGSNSSLTTVLAKLRTKVDVVADYGATGLGIVADDAAIQKAINDVSTAGGGKVTFPAGTFLLSASLNRLPGVFLVGEGAESTQLKANGNFSVITTIGTSSNVLNRGGVSDMLIRGYGATNSSAHGIYEAWTNRSIYSNLRFHSCRYAMYASNVWQVKWDNLQADGLGTDQNYIGFYMSEVDPSNQNNAVTAVNCLAQNCSQYGWRLINFNGSKFTSCEGAGSATYGWYLGDPTTGTQAIRWGHFVNCLADTTTSHGWRIEKGSATSCEQMQFTNCWSGNSSGGNGWNISGASNLIITSPMVVSSNMNSIYFTQSSRCVVSAANLMVYDGAATGYSGIALDSSSFVEITGSHIYSTSSTAKALVETGSSDSNLAIGNFLQNSFTKLGANSRFIRNNGAGGERTGSAQITSSATIVTVTHNMAFTPSINDVRITPRDGGGSATKYWVANMTSTTFDINVNTAPGATITIAWAIDPIGQ